VLPHALTRTPKYRALTTHAKRPNLKEKLGGKHVSGPGKSLRVLPGTTFNHGDSVDPKMMM
jgi:hypothetical protein